MLSPRAGRGQAKGKAPKARRVRLQTDTRRAQLLELGMDFFAARAYEDIVIDDLAAAAGGRA